MNVDGAVHLQDCVKVNLKNITGPSDCEIAAKDAEKVSKLEELVSGWRKQIEQVCFHLNFFCFVVAWPLRYTESKASNISSFAVFAFKRKTKS